MEISIAAIISGKDFQNEKDRNLDHVGQKELIVLCEYGLREICLIPFDWEMGGWGVTKLVLNCCGLKSIDGVGLMKNLEVVDLKFNYIERLDNEITVLKKLRYLDLSFNPLRWITPKIDQCCTLEILILKMTKLWLIPITVTNLRNLCIIDLNGTRTINAPGFHRKIKVTNHDNNYLEVKNELFKTLKSSLTDKKSWTAGKIIVLGEENVGKTLFISKLRKVKYKKNISTDGIEISSVEFGQMSMSVYDFGGQEVFYPTHQLFLSENAIFILMFNIINCNMSRITYWLNTIREKTAYAKVVLIGTHLDLIRDEEPLEELKDRILKLRHAEMIEHIEFISNKRKKDIVKIRLLLTDILGSLDSVSTQVPLCYFHIIEYFNRLRNEKSYVYFKEISDDFASHTLASLKTMFEYFHDAGLILWVSCRDDGLIVLDPQWLAKLFASIVSFTQNWDNGKLPHDMFPLIWREYDEVIREDVLKLLEKVHLVYTYSENDIMMSLVPCMFNKIVSKEYVERAKYFHHPNLNTTISQDEESSEVLVFLLDQETKYLRYHRKYSFSHVYNGFFSSIVVRLLQDIKNRDVEYLYYAHGIFIAEKDYSEAILFEINIELSEFSVIGLSSESFGKNAVYLFTTLLYLIQSSIKNEKILSVGETAECPHCFRNCSSHPIHFDYEYIMEQFLDGKNSLICVKTNIFICDIAPDISLSQIPLLKSELTLIKELGKTTIGTFYKAEFELHGQVIKAAVKRIHNYETLMDKFNEFSHEINIMSTLNHPNLLKIYGFKTDPDFLLIMEYCREGSLYDLLYTDTVLSEDLLIKISLDIAKGLLYLQDKVNPPIIHNDIRSANIFMYSLDEYSEVCAKIGDFGHAQQKSGKNESTNSWQWLAPEVLRSETYSHQSDTFSYGILLSEIYTRKKPYREFHQYIITKLEEIGEISNKKDFNKHHFTIIDGYAVHQVWDESKIINAITNEYLRPRFLDSNPTCIKDIARGCFKIDPQERPSFREIVSSLTEYCDYEKKYSDQSEDQIEIPEILSNKYCSFHHTESEVCSIEEIPRNSTIGNVQLFYRMGDDDSYVYHYDGHSLTISGKGRIYVHDEDGELSAKKSFYSDVVIGAIIKNRVYIISTTVISIFRFSDGNLSKEEYETKLVNFAAICEKYIILNMNKKIYIHDIKSFEVTNVMSLDFKLKTLKLGQLNQHDLLVCAGSGQISLYVLKFGEDNIQHIQTIYTPNTIGVSLPSDDEILLVYSTSNTHIYIINESVIFNSQGIVHSLVKEKKKKHHEPSEEDHLLNINAFIIAKKTIKDTFILELHSEEQKQTIIDTYVSERFVSGIENPPIYFRSIEGNIYSIALFVTAKCRILSNDLVSIRQNSWNTAKQLSWITGKLHFPSNRISNLAKFIKHTEKYSEYTTGYPVSYIFDTMVNQHLF